MGDVENNDPEINMSREFVRTGESAAGIQRASIFALALTLSTASSAAAGSSESTWRLGWANDEIMGSDNQFTNGAFLQLSSATAGSLAATSGTPAFSKALAAWVLPERDGLHYRESWTLGHNMQTPDDIGRRDLIVTDVPYVGMAGWSNSFYAFDDREFTGFQTLVGWVGDLALAEPVQTTTHAITRATEPKGWDNQLANEPLLNVYAMRKVKFFNGRWLDAAWNVDGALGNFFTQAQAALELRFGRRPGGFIPSVLPVGHMLDQDARLGRSDRGYFYASAIVRASAVAFAMPRDGNLLRDGDRWTENERIDTERLLGQLVLGLHYERPAWGLHLQLHLATDSASPINGGDLVDPGNNFGMLVGEWRL